MAAMFLYAGPFVLLVSIPALFYGAGPAAPLATVGLLLAALIGAEFLSQRGAVLDAGTNPSGYRALLAVYIPAQIGVTAWAISAAAQAPLVGFVSLAISVGVTTGVFGMLAAHEMVHSTRRDERLLGTAMLSAMCYRHFRIAHVHAHHRWAATALDSATARLGEGFYGFLARTLGGQFREAFRLECKRCRTKGWFANRVLRDLAVYLLLLGFIVGLAGLAGFWFFLAQSAVAIMVLEMFNYIAHYGLVRRKIAEHRFEPLDDRHSWNSSNVVANLLIFNMGRHSDHHRRPTVSYEDLCYLREAPELPAGYAASILMALIPPLWRVVMDPRARRARADATQAPALGAVLSDSPGAAR